MSDDALNASIAAKWEAAGFNGGNDDLEVAAEPDVAEVTEGDTDFDPAADDTEAVVDPNAADPVEPDTTEEVEPEPAAVVDPPATEKPAIEPAVQEAEDGLAEALGLGKPPEDPKKRAQWWKSRLPYSQIHKVVAEREKKLNETHAGVLKTHTDKVTEYDKRFVDVKTVEDLIRNDAEQYVTTLSAMFPDTYGKMFAPILGGKTPEPLLEPVDPGPRPEPDYKLPDGSMTYGLDGYQKLMDWQAKVTKQEVLTNLKPHLDFVQSQQKEAEKRQQKDAAEQTRQTGMKTANDAVAEVKTWDLGTENIEAILAEAAKLDPSYSAVTALNIAYRKIVMPKLKANRDEMHAAIVGDLKKASAKQTAAGLTQTRTAATAPANSSTVDLNTRIKNAWKRKGLI